MELPHTAHRAYWRHGLVVALCGVAGLVSIAAHTPTYAAPLPAISTLLAKTQWHVASLDAQNGWQGYSYKQWVLADGQGNHATLYVGAASAVQKVVHWTGELGYLGDGYGVVGQAREQTYLDRGRVAPIMVVSLKRLGTYLAVAYAAVSPAGITALPSDNIVSLGWDVLRGSNGPYYVVRVSVQPPAGDPTTLRVPRATQLLGEVVAAVSHS